MTQEWEERDADAVKTAQAELIATARKRQKLSQDKVTRLVNEELTRAGWDGISRGHYANIEAGRRTLTEGPLRAVSVVLGIPEARLRNPFAELWAGAA